MVMLMQTKKYWPTGNHAGNIQKYSSWNDLSSGDFSKTRLWSAGCTWDECAPMTHCLQNDILVTCLTTEKGEL
jgi:hypothetical protein